MADEWQPIETAPRDGTELLLWVPSPALGFLWEMDGAAVQGAWEDGMWCLRFQAGDAHNSSFFFEDSDPNAPTHWQNVPTPPANPVREGEGA